MENMNKLEELVSKLHNAEDRDIDSLNKFAKENNFVFIFGYSDDCVEFRGSIYDEGYCYGGGNLPFTKKGLVNDTGELEDALKVLTDNGYDVSSIHAQTNTVKAVRDTKGVWRFETDIPHKTFNVMEDGELSSVGIAFRMEDLK